MYMRPCVSDTRSVSVGQCQTSPGVCWVLDVHCHVHPIALCMRVRSLKRRRAQAGPGHAGRPGQAAREDAYVTFCRRVVPGRHYPSVPHLPRHCVSQLGVARQQNRRRAGRHEAGDAVAVAFIAGKLVLARHEHGHGVVKRARERRERDEREQC